MALSDEIIAGPIVAYVAPLATAFPVPDAAPGAAWIKLGAQGDKNITEEGVKISVQDEVQFWRSLGSTGPMKGFRTSEDVMVEFELADHTLEMLSHAFGGGAIAAPTGVVVTPPVGAVDGYRELALLRGFSIVPVALLLRKTGDSPYNPLLNIQWQIPRAVAHGQPEIVYVKDGPALISFSYQLLQDPTLGFGKVIMADVVGA